MLMMVRAGCLCRPCSVLDLLHWANGSRLAVHAARAGAVVVGCQTTQRLQKLHIVEGCSRRTGEHSITDRSGDRMS